MGDTSLGKLRRALERFPRDRYPIKHASLQRAIARELALDGSSTEAEAALRVAIEIYGERFPSDRADTLNSLGAVLRDQGRLSEAAEAFLETVSILEGTDQHAELGVAHHNLGLVRVQQDDRPAAIEAFQTAAGHLDPSSHPAELAAALRELGAALMLEGGPEEAVGPLERSAELAAKGGDRAGLGSATNVIGLARLALDEPQAAAASFAESASAHALAVRPEGHAMAKANLALAYEALDESARARQAASHSSSIPEAPKAVAEQAAAILQRLGMDYDLHEILDAIDPEEWPGMLREEVRHWLRSGAAYLESAVVSWVEGMAARPGTAVDRAETLFDALLELETANFDEIARQMCFAIATRDVDQEETRGMAARAAARFRLPQMRRLEMALGLGDDA